ncbi:MAG: hypothetical protein GEU79_07625 [Acidimicrobiia bacterium]|nr:hypothetical protein [Acidimicrobiia bacterium]
MTPHTAMELVRATSIDEVVDALRIKEGARILNGGTEVTRQISMGESSCSTLVDIKRVPGLSGIVVNGGALTIGATTKHWDIGENADVARLAPGLARACGSLGNLRVRAQGSLGGNLAFGHPQSDPGAALLSQGATVVTAGPDGERRMDIEEVWMGPYQTGLETGECVLRIEVDPLASGWIAGYRRVEILHRPPSLTLGVCRFIEAGTIRGIRIGVGGVGDVPRRVRRVEELISGAPVDQCREILEQSREDVVDDIQPRADQVYSAEEKVTLFTNVLSSLLRMTMERSHDGH